MGYVAVIHCSTRFASTHFLPVNPQMETLDILGTVYLAVLCALMYLYTLFPYNIFNSQVKFWNILR